MMMQDWEEGKVRVEDQMMKQVEEEVDEMLKVEEEEVDEMSKVEGEEMEAMEEVQWMWRLHHQSKHMVDQLSQDLCPHLMMKYYDGYHLKYHKHQKCVAPSSSYHEE